MPTDDIIAASIKLKPGNRPRVLRGHPWIFSGEIKALLPPECDGTAVFSRDSRGRFLGTGLYNGRSRIVWRRLSRGRITWVETFVREAIGRALKRRGNAPHGRLVWSEADDLPGLVVDRYGDVLVVQFLTLGTDRVADTILDTLREALHPREILLRNDAPARGLEGLDAEVRTVSGRSLPPEWVMIEGMQYRIDWTSGQKTGFYLDQRLEHVAVGAYAQGARVLDAFCHQGGFALHCARAGASDVLGVDISEDAVAGARGNAERNGLEVEFETANVFDFLRQQEAGSRDLVVLDPPPFAKARGELKGALRGYKEINLRAMKVLASGGVLATYACSAHVDWGLFTEVVTSAAADAGRKATVLRFCHQPPDHPVLLAMPESEYLRGLVLRVDRA